MNRVRYLLLLVISVTLIYCGGDSADDSIKVKRKTESTPLSELRGKSTDRKILKITNVAFGKMADVENDLTATPVLSDKGATAEFRYRWLVNDIEVEGENSNTLSRDFFREGDWVFCRVGIISGDEISTEFVSDRVRIKGPIPVLNLSEIGNFSPPGIFRYKIVAGMPEIEDLEPEFGDEDEVDPEKAVKFELIAPLDKGIVLDPLTGEITWDITDELLSQLGDKIEIKFSVISPSGRKINSSITLNLSVVEQNSENSVDNSELGYEIE